jgi:O-antigen ligase/polysaccharide polymerase Wzy-like membrane protein
MIALALCILALGVTYWAGKRSLGQGLVALFTFGYAYGIVRANLLTTYAHFTFDSALLGLFLSQKWTLFQPSQTKRLGALQLWTVILIGWPILMILMPFQPLLVSLVGLRGSVFFLPMLLLGTKLREKDLLQVSVGFAALNLIAIGFGGAEYFLGLSRFYPLSPVTFIVYASNDIAGGFYRIPAIFTNAHAYGGSMVASVPYLIGGWERAATPKTRLLAVLGIAAAFLGVLLSATRLNFLTGVVLLAFTLAAGRMKAGRWIAFAVVIIVIGYIGLTNERLQRFKSLSETDFVTERIHGSVNRSFFEILADHPMGNGLGGGGTSVPYFLEGQVRNPIATENEYIRILCEQGVIGLILWLSFVIWYLTGAGTAYAKGPWTVSRRSVWGLSSFILCTIWIGNGFLTAIPGTALALLGIGWTAVPMPASPPLNNRVRPRSMALHREGAHILQVP